MGKGYCGEEHLPGQTFYDEMTGTQRIYCKRCGNCIAESKYDPVSKQVKDAITGKVVDWSRDLNGNLVTYNGE